MIQFLFWSVTCRVKGMGRGSFTAHRLVSTWLHAAMCELFRFLFCFLRSAVKGILDDRQFLYFHLVVVSLFPPSDFDITGCVLNYFEGTVNLLVPQAVHSLLYIIRIRTNSEVPISIPLPSSIQHNFGATAVLMSAMLSLKLAFKKCLICSKMTWQHNLEGNIFGQENVVVCLDFICDGMCGTAYGFFHPPHCFLAPCFPFPISSLQVTGLSKPKNLKSLVKATKVHTLGPARASGLRKKSSANNENNPSFQATISSLWKNYSFKK